jgi:phage protein D
MDTAGSPAASTPVAARTEMAPAAPSGELALGSAFAMKPPSAAPAAEAGDRAKKSHYLRDSPDAAKAPPLDADVKAGAEGVALGFRDGAAGDRYAVTVSDVAGPGARASEKESVVDALNKTEGVRIAALFSYP